MCIAIAKQKDIAIQENILETCFDNNPDGAGFAVEEDDGSFHVEKGFFSFKDFMEAFRPHENKKALIHFRIKTHGTYSKENCHPFKVDDDVVFIHNGMINNVPSHKTQSDTRVFKRLFLRPIIKRFGADALNDKLTKRLIEGYIGGSKLAFMIKGQKKFTIMNKEMGNFSKEGIWFSNMSWQPRPSYPKLPTYSYGKQSPAPTCQTPTYTTPTTVRKEVSEITGFNGDSFSFGTIVKLRWKHDSAGRTLDKGAMGEVDRVYSDRSMDINFYDGTKEYGIMAYQMDEVRDLEEIEWGLYGMQ